MICRTLVSGLCFLAAPLLAEQVGLRGPVTDPTGGVVAGAKVEARGAGRTARATVTDVAGNYEIRSLAAGAWTVHVVRDGFKPFDSGRIEISSARVLDIRLQIADLHDDVTVTSDDREPKVDGATSGTNSVA